jgi:hypothetical protein
MSIFTGVAVVPRDQQSLEQRGETYSTRRKIASVVGATDWAREVLPRRRPSLMFRYPPYRLMSNWSGID